MIRTILIFILFVLLYHSLKTVIRSATRAARGEEERTGLPGAEMVLDPECRTYVLKERALVRTQGGVRRYFCSEACAEKHEAREHA